MSVIHLARAERFDVEGIEAIVREVWEREILPDVARAQIADPEAALWVAKEKDSVVGFASAFQTLDRWDRRRWEIDLVAVRPGQQGRGLGQKLIRRVSREAASRGAALARALVGLENAPSQRAFQKAGFTMERLVHRLLLWAPLSAPTPALCPRRISLVPVDTLTYRGVWIEGLDDAGQSERGAAVAAARSLVAQQGRESAGAVLPRDKIGLLPRTVRAEAENRGDYYWFSKHGTPRGPGRGCAHP